MNNILLSVIIPVYNTGNYLIDCIDSIYNQDLDINEFEVILVNDGSTDNSLTICQNYAAKYPNIKIIDQDNRGQSVARNEGLKASSGDYLYMIDSDDYLKKKSMKLILNFMERNILDFLGFNMKRTCSRTFSESLNEELSIRFRGTGIDILKEFNFNNGPWWYIFKRNVIHELKFIEGRFCEDGLFTPRLIMNVKNAIILDNIIYFYYENNTSTIKSKNVKKNLKMIDDMFFAVTDFDQILQSIPENNQKAYQRLRGRQETYLYFAIIRFLKLHTNSKELIKKINELNFNNYTFYTMNSFKGYSKLDRFLILIINNKFSLQILNYLNCYLKVIK